MKNKLCALSLILLLISCSDEIQQFDDSTKQTQNENKELTTRSLDTDDHALGFGYDVTGDYLDKYSIRNSVIDIVKLREFDKNSIITSNEVSGKNQYYYGYTSYDYIKEITKKVHPYGIDISSGIETDGYKDLKKMKEIMQITGGRHE